MIYPMIYYVSVSLDSLEDSIDRIAREGFHPEIRMDNADRLMELSNGEVGRLKQLLSERAFTSFTHAPFFGLDIASLDTKVSAYTESALMRALEVTALLGGLVMVMHTGYLPYFSRAGRRLWFRNWGSRMPRIVEKAEQLGVAILLENTWEDRPEVLAHLIDLIPRMKVGICLDTGHLNVFSRLPLRNWWRLLGSRVEAFHIHDNDGISDDHLVPGEGTFDFGELAGLIRRLESPPLMDLEVPLERAAEGRRYIESLLGP